MPKFDSKQADICPALSNGYGTMAMAVFHVRGSPEAGHHSSKTRMMLDRNGTSPNQQPISLQSANFIL
jgi:hypothetical protein